MDKKISNKDYYTFSDILRNFNAEKILGKKHVDVDGSEEANLFRIIFVNYYNFYKVFKKE